MREYNEQDWKEVEQDWKEVEQDWHLDEDGDRVMIVPAGDQADGA